MEWWWKTRWRCPTWWPFRPVVIISVHFRTPFLKVSPMILTLTWTLNFLEKFEEIIKNNKTAKLLFSITISISSKMSKSKAEFKEKNWDKSVARKANRFPRVITKRPDWNPAKHACRRVSGRDITIYGRDASFRWDWSRCSVTVSYKRELFCAFWKKKITLRGFKFAGKTLFTPRKCYFRLFKDLNYLQCTYLST